MKKVDLHNDLLNYLLTDDKRTAYDNGLECSIPEMIHGGISVQVLAAFTLTPGSSDALCKQLRRYEHIKGCSESLKKEIHFLWAIEDAQQLVSPSELGVTIEEKITTFVRTDNTPVYISLTWVNENDLGGGDRTNVGIKSRGVEILNILASTRIAIDLSHASDKLAYDIINYREKKGLKNPVIVSHTNFRSVNDVPRNISDEVAHYVLAQNGLIGLSFSKRQLGNRDTMNVGEHYEYALHLNSAFADVLCLGGDLYHQDDVPKELRGAPSNFYPELSKASDYSSLDAMDETFLSRNALRYLHKNGFIVFDNVPRVSQFGI